VSAGVPSRTPTPAAADSASDTDAAKRAAKSGRLDR
jgi:hypothetical protein